VSGLRFRRCYEQLEPKNLIQRFDRAIEGRNEERKKEKRKKKERKKE